MRFDPDRLHRRSTRLADYDYTLPGSYFVTICTYHRLNLFNDLGLRNIAEDEWQSLPSFDPCIRIDAWVIMPNHVHGIIDFVERSSRSQAEAMEIEQSTPLRGLGVNVRPGSLGAIVRSYKSVVTRRAHKLGKLSVGPIWQRGFWERVIRDERELDAIRRYIEDNPRRWAEDRDNLDALFGRMRKA